MDEILTQHLQTYARRNNLRLAERLGRGIHGIVYAAERNAEPGNVAIKVHRSREVHDRERDVYLRLKEAGVAEILGFNVPQLIGSDDELLIIEMSIVARPFVLDFAGAYLDSPPKFSDEIWSEWEAEKRDQFEDRWPKVQAVRARWRSSIFTWWRFLRATLPSWTEDCGTFYRSVPARRWSSE